MAAESSATTTWQGSLDQGLRNELSGERRLPRTSRSRGRPRTDALGRKTSPEELLAAAHASCYCMALSHELARPATSRRAEATATVAFVPGEGVKSSHIVVTGACPASTSRRSSEAANSAGQNCPISGALKGNIEITVEATLEG